MNAAQRFAYLHAQTPFSSYLEIGVARGATFEKVPAAIKTAVDPHFLYAYKPSKTSRYFEMTSDEFFQRLPATETFDLIYIDGLHRWQQVIRDLDNALMHSHPATLIVLDDVYPCDQHSILPNQSAAVQSRALHSPRSPDGAAWHGDVFKAAFKIALYYPELSYVTITPDYGNSQMFCWRQPTDLERQRKAMLQASRGAPAPLPKHVDVSRLPTSPMDDNTLDGLTYADFLTYRSLLNLCPEPAALRRIATALQGLRHG